MYHDDRPAPINATSRIQLSNLDAIGAEDPGALCLSLLNHVGVRITEVPNHDANAGTNLSRLFLTAHHGRGKGNQRCYRKSSGILVMSCYWFHLVFARRLSVAALVAFSPSVVCGEEKPAEIRSRVGIVVRNLSDANAHVIQRAQAECSRIFGADGIEIA